MPSTATPTFSSRDTPTFASNTHHHMNHIHLFTRRPVLLLASLAVIFLPWTGRAEVKPAEKIEWNRSLQELKEKTPVYDKPVLIRFSAKWCGPCRVMAARVWPDAEVVKAVNNAYTPIDVDIDTPEAAAVVDQFGINVVPTIVVLDRQGNEMARTNFMSVEQTLVFLRKENKALSPR